MKLLIMVLIILVMITSILPATVQAVEHMDLALPATEIQIMADGLPLNYDWHLYNVNGRIMAPLLTLFKEFDTLIEYGTDTRCMLARSDDDTIIVVTIGDNALAVNGEVVAIDSPIMIIDDIVYAPLRFIAEAFGARVEWDEETRTVAITNTTGSTESNNIADFAGYITIESDTLYLDEVEILLIQDEKDFPWLPVKPYSYPVAINDYERMADLGITENDLLNGYYIHHLDKEIISYELTDGTFFSFIDVNLLFVEDADGDRRYTTRNKSEYIQYLHQYYDIPNPPYAVFCTVQGKRVIAVVEMLLFTQ